MKNPPYRRLQLIILLTKLLLASDSILKLTVSDSRLTHIYDPHKSTKFPDPVGQWHPQSAYVVKLEGVNR